MSSKCNLWIMNSTANDVKEHKTDNDHLSETIAMTVGTQHCQVNVFALHLQLPFHENCEQAFKQIQWSADHCFP